MPHPKRKLSRSRRDSRRGHDKAVASTLCNCSNCGAPTLYHRVCNECGYYKGKLAVEKKVSA
ncbi:MAG: ribosomal protein [Bacteroidetes bacterium]|jgi:large subunit ribosomal protein L32|nr:ribosomal protein [Bacteroidota bacterium]